MLDVNVVRVAIGYLVWGGNSGFAIDVTSDELDKRPAIAKLDMQSRFAKHR